MSSPCDSPKMLTLYFLPNVFIFLIFMKCFLSGPSPWELYLWLSAIYAISLHGEEGRLMNQHAEYQLFESHSISENVP